MRHTHGAGVAIDADGMIRRQKMTTWGILAFAVFVSVGMAEWSNRSAMGEKVVGAQVLERALTIAEKMEDRRWEMGISDFGNRNSDSGKNLSDLGVSAVKPAAAVNVNVNENLGGGLPATSNPKHATLRSESVATMQTSAGE